MRNSLAKGATLAVLAGALLIPSVPASATTSGAATKAADPYSSFTVKVQATKKTKPGGKIQYTIVGTNKGPHYADSWFLGGVLPKDVDLKKVYYRSNLKGMVCDLYGRALYCAAPVVVEVGDSVAIILDTKLKKGAKGTQKATLGVVTYNVDQGMENMSKEELDRLGIPEFGFGKTVKTKVSR